MKRSSSLFWISILMLVTACNQPYSAPARATNTPFPSSAFQQPMPEPTNTPANNSVPENLEYIPVDGVFTRYENPSLGYKCTRNTTDHLLGKGFSFHYTDLSEADVWINQTGGITWTLKVSGVPGNLYNEQPDVALRFVGEKSDGKKILHTIVPCGTYITVIESIEDPKLLIVSGTDEIGSIDFSGTVIAEDLQTIPMLWNDHTEGNGVSGITTSTSTQGQYQLVKWDGFQNPITLEWHDTTTLLAWVTIDPFVCYDSLMITWKKLENTRFYAYETVECGP